MTERPAERAPSVSSSSTEAEAFDEKHGSATSTEGRKTPDEMEIGDDVERAELLPEEHEKPAQTSTPDNSMRSAVIWMVVNTL